LLTGAGSFSLQRTKDFRVIGEPSFPLRKARDWNLMLRSAKLWQQADQKQLDDEIHSLLNDKQYVPKVLFETPRSLKDLIRYLSVFSASTYGIRNTPISLG
jgi:hypothetical protein